MEKNKVLINNEGAALYIRVSTENESQDGSYKEQLDELKTFARQKGFYVKKVY